MKITITHRYGKIPARPVGQHTCHLKTYNTRDPDYSLFRKEQTCTNNHIISNDLICCTIIHCLLKNKYCRPYIQDNGRLSGQRCTFMLTFHFDNF